jgi:hypothetical protein
LMFLAGGAVIWHLLACVESPMAFSPDGKRLAFTIIEPYPDEQEDWKNRARSTYRVLSLEDGRTLRVIEETADALLTAPGWSPDGKELCYLRIPLLTDEEHAQRRKLKEDSGSPAPLHGDDEYLLEVKEFEQRLRRSESPPRPAFLVVRDAATMAVLRTTRLALWGVSREEELPAYLLSKPSCGRPSFHNAGGLLYAVDSDTQSLLASGVFAATALAPDGRTLAALGVKGEQVFLISPEGNMLRRIQPEREASWDGLAWVDARTLAVLGGDSDKRMARIMFKRIDDIPSPESIKFIRPNSPEGQMGELAVSPDGRHLVVSYGSTVLFMDGSGRLLDTWVSPYSDLPDPGAGGWLVQPVFTPDSRFVALKRVVRDEELRIPEFVRVSVAEDVVCGNVSSKVMARTTEIVFFTPDGKESRSIPISAAAYTRDLAWQLPRK